MNLDNTSIFFDRGLGRIALNVKQVARGEQGEEKETVREQLKFIRRLL